MGATELRAAVIGAGRLGALHAAKYATTKGVRLSYVVDIDPKRAAQVAAAHGATPLADYRELMGRLKGSIDLASVAAPCVAHHEIGSALLAAGIDVLLEKPMAATIAEAQDLAALAERCGRILQVGHLERFNPAIVRLHSIVTSPRFIECHRLAPFTERGTDVDVLLDLMIHDLDVILFLTGAEIVSVEAVGVAVLTDIIDVANARIRFSDGTDRQPQQQPRGAAPRAQNPLLPARRLRFGRLRRAPHTGLSQDSALARQRISGDLGRADRSRTRRSAGR